MSNQRTLQFARNIVQHDVASVADIFKIGIGPSSSHTVGPMVAARRFVERYIPPEIDRILVTAFGSLAWTGHGHATDIAIILGLAGYLPADLDPDHVPQILDVISQTQMLELPEHRTVAFLPQRDIKFDRKTRHGRHSNALRFQAFKSGQVVADEMFYSIGGGIVVNDSGEQALTAAPSIPFPFAHAAELLDHCEKNQKSMADLVLANEAAIGGEAVATAYIDKIIQTMMGCLDRGLQQGHLPGPLKVARRAKALHDRLIAETAGKGPISAHHTLEFVSAFAMAVNEENASGGRVVTAPTNGAAGVIPAVLRYYRDFHPAASTEGMRTFLLTATAIGSLIKGKASISGAEVGCQGEVGSAASMAAAGLAAAYGATAQQVENAAEIAMEHHLGMTCDPIGGLVQIPCIERNAFGAVKAINAALLAMRGDGAHYVSLDQVTETMWQTGRDMKTKYKETSRGGLAINVPNC